MPIEIGISTDLDLAYAHWFGRVELADFRKMFEDYLAGPEFRPGRREFCDFSELGELDVGFKQVWSALSMVNGAEDKSGPPTSCNIFAPQDTAYGVARMYQSLAEFEGGVQVKIFRREEDILAALRLDVASVKELRARCLRPTTMNAPQLGLLGEPDP
ncbi:hypothetical protein [Lentibacter sp.]|uniref:hypothetical protein n=1 Tax=Lentibacter sp. TaxID=2024994 RepID=UPI003F6C60F1